jgi:putative NADH-flavin reductase
MSRSISNTGASGYLVRSLRTELLARGHAVRAIVRHGSAARAPVGGDVHEVNVFDVTRLSAALRTGDTSVHLIGTPNPKPRKAAEFERAHLASVRIATVAAERQPEPGLTRIIEVPESRAS